MPTALTVSIHPILLLISGIWYLVLDSQSFNTSYITINPEQDKLIAEKAKGFNTSYITINPRLTTPMQRLHHCFNTSYITINPTNNRPNKKV